MSPHRKRDGRFLCVEVFSQEIEELRQESFKNGEKCKIGNVKTPTRLHTLSLYMSTFCFSINAILSHKLGASSIVLL
jgi:hypothetical protein